MAVVAAGVNAQGIPVATDTRHSMLREAMLGLLKAQAPVDPAVARTSCLVLPVAPPNDRIDGPHGDSLISAHCEVAEYRVLDSASTPSHWASATYRWETVFTAEDTTRGKAARDTVIEEEVVLFEAAPAPGVRPVWHERIETGTFAVWRSVTPRIVRMPDGSHLLSVMSCVNGTGGCSQEFVHRHRDGSWAGVWQAWFDQLPSGYRGRILHGVKIDPATLRGVSGFYGPRDPNCCPSEDLKVNLALRGDSLVLLRHSIVRNP